MLHHTATTCVHHDLPEHNMSLWRKGVDAACPTRLVSFGQFGALTREGSHSRGANLPPYEGHFLNFSTRPKDQIRLRLAVRLI